MTTPEINEIRRHDAQADIFLGRYQIVAKGEARGEFVVEHLADDEISEKLIIEHYANAEANGYGTTPIWSKTWAECVGDERPVRVGYLTHEEELIREIDRRAEIVGTRSTYRFVSSAAYAAAF